MKSEDNSERHIRTFEDLQVWKSCTKIRREFSKLALNDQIVRAARSVTNNIAEGYGRYHYQENMQFCRQSRGSLYELIDHAVICIDEKYIDEKKFFEYRDQCLEAIRLLNGYIRFLSKQKTDAQSDH